MYNGHLLIKKRKKEKKRKRTPIHFIGNNLLSQFVMPLFYGLQDINSMANVLLLVKLVPHFFVRVSGELRLLREWRSLSGQWWLGIY
jgi:hypothetical protein